MSNELILAQGGKPYATEDKAFTGARNRGMKSSDFAVVSYMDGFAISKTKNEEAPPDTAPVSEVSPSVQREEVESQPATHKEETSMNQEKAPDPVFDPDATASYTNRDAFVMTPETKADGSIVYHGFTHEHKYIGTVDDTGKRV